ncbi:MAG: bifunctional UDP-3-O-[3-hydroxymyristoyl] N-acetylglucosamine deacetylase/3-hydroxyacyl-ACP dehydratase [Candidatus Marinimicrobia bacterium]|nr:bifunctional UDP-3-O-[3-hydroxymyristoyl] N-acetylglucosamine deacetylase/3-hydroxyacyl-ACP dehydratase [Candidatus Neomarinimicrobiota bacterium]
MIAKNQHTIKEKACVSGIGLHTGIKSKLTFRPAKPNTGIRFLRTDLEKPIEIPADIEHVVDISRGTKLGINGNEIHTVEHVLAAVSGLEIDNLLIELSGPEPPVMDGSAKPFVDALLSARIVEQEAVRKKLIIDKTVTFNDPAEEVDIHVTPSDRFRITFMVQYDDEVNIGTQYYAIYSLSDNFINEIAPARTFSLLSEVESLKNNGLIKGGNLDNAIIFVDKPIEKSEKEKLKKLFNIKDTITIGEKGILNNRRLRYPNEPVRHKILDLIGDLCLLGVPMQGHVVAARSGHRSNVELVKKIRRMFNKQFIQKEFAEARKEQEFISIDIETITKILPHRYPFLMVDRITKLTPKNKIIAIKNVSVNEPYFTGHFPEKPVMPGVMILEALGQAGGVLLLNSLANPDSKLVMFTSMDKVKFRKVVTPGDQLQLKVSMVRQRANFTVMEAAAYVDGKMVASAKLSAAITEK